MSEQLILYLQIDGDADVRSEELAAAIRGLESVTEVDAQVEEPVRSGAEILQEITVTVTALGGTVGAVNLLVGEVQKLLAKFRVRSAQVETEGEGLRELFVGGTPRNENPAQ